MFHQTGGVVFSAFDQVPADLHVNAIVLGCLSFGVALLMLIDLADPMARHRSDTTQTDPIVASNIAINAQPALTRVKENAENVQPPIDAQYGVQRQQPLQTHQHAVASALELDPTAGLYTRGDAVDYVHARSMPVVQSAAVEHVNGTGPSASHHPQSSQLYPAAFERTLLPEKQRPRREIIPDPHRNTAQLQYSNLSYVQEHMQPVPRPVPPPIPKRTGVNPQQYHPFGAVPPVSMGSFSRQQSCPAFNTAPVATTHNAQYNARTMQPPQYNHQHQSQQHANAPRPHSLRDRKNPHYHGHGGGCGGPNSDSGEEDALRRRPSAIQPGFVAHAARFWDQRASQRTSPNHSNNNNNNSGANSELNTIV